MLKEEEVVEDKTKTIKERDIEVDIKLSRNEISRKRERKRQKTIE